MTRPVVTADPAVAFFQPTVRGRRCLDLAGTHWAGDDACDEYDVSKAELLTACAYLAWYGEPRWRRRWKAWADRWCDALARGEYDVIPLPPRKDDADAAQGPTPPAGPANPATPATRVPEGPPDGR